jgi:hypothetical protein
MSFESPGRLALSKSTFICKNQHQDQKKRKHLENIRTPHLIHNIWCFLHRH